MRWALTAFGVTADRVTIVSRGDTASWYSGIDRPRYVDAFDLMSPAELTTLGKDAKPKQTAFDDNGADELLRRVKSAYGLDDVACLLPHWMYRLYEPYRTGNVSLDFIEKTRYGPLSVDAGRALSSAPSQVDRRRVRAGVPSRRRPLRVGPA